MTRGRENHSMSKHKGKKKSSTKSIAASPAASTANSTLWIAVSGVLLLAVIIAFFAIGSWNKSAGEQVPTDKASAGSGGNQATADQDSLENTGEPVYADIVIEDYGTITISLNPEYAPETVRNFVSLAESGFYNGLTFHRIIEGFMMQGGDPKGNGFGGSETTITGEFAANGHDNPLSHIRGTVSMARANDPNSASSQFFIVHQDSTFLDGNYAAFGTVTSGMEIVDEICAAAEPIDDNGLIATEAQPVISSITIH